MFNPLLPTLDEALATPADPGTYNGFYTIRSTTKRDPRLREEIEEWTVEFLGSQKTMRDGRELPFIAWSGPGTMGGCQTEELAERRARGVFGGRDPEGYTCTPIRVFT